MQKLKDIELYYSPIPLNGDNLILAEKDELNHILRVMRHKEGDEIYITDGRGRIYKTTILSLTGEKLTAQLLEGYEYEDKNKNLIFCIPRLRSAERFETALEKCTELGMTNFIILDSERTIPKGNKKNRWEKILTSAMKQSLRSFLPQLKMSKLSELAAAEGNKILFVQDADRDFDKSVIRKNEKTYFIFGPEGDFTDDEKKLFQNADFYNLGENRLRSETAIIKCASILS
jgi:16S rRNA (uracil1498-N3)-methyltransferase